MGNYKRLQSFSETQLCYISNKPAICVEHCADTSEESWKWLPTPKPSNMQITNICKQEAKLLASPAYILL